MSFLYQFWGYLDIILWKTLPKIPLKIKKCKSVSTKAEKDYLCALILKNMSKKEEFLSFDVLIEIPKGSRNKYEYDFELHKIRYDRMIFSSMMYPADYGFIPESLALDSDPLDVLVLVSEPTFPGCVMRVKPIGVFHMADEKGPDEKVICVPVSDPVWNKLNDLNDVNPHLKSEIEHFFQVYKDLEKKKVAVNGWGNLNEAIKIYHECKNRYKNQTEKTFTI